VDAWETLLTQSKDDDAPPCYHLAEKYSTDVLGRIQDRRAVEPLIAALGDASKQVRSGVASALGQLQDARAVEPLLIALRDPSDEVRGEAAAALGQLQDKRAVAPLFISLRDKSYMVRHAVVWALGEFEDGSVVEPLLTTLQKDSTEVREAAAWALGQLQDERAIEPLDAALQDGSEAVCWAAWALRARSWQPANVEQHALWTDATERFTTTIAEGNTFIELLLTALRDDSAAVRQEVVMALKQWKEPQTVEPLHSVNLFSMSTLITPHWVVEPLLAAM
jgi:HEAT repeat protein